jgi:hypothetical protein
MSVSTWMPTLQIGVDSHLGLWSEPIDASLNDSDDSFAASVRKCRAAQASRLNAGRKRYIPFQDGAADIVNPWYGHPRMERTPAHLPGASKLSMPPGL